MTTRQAQKLVRLLRATATALEALHEDKCLGPRGCLRGAKCKLCQLLNEVDAELLGHERAEADR